ncbi:hypothetical protein OK348_06435 [Flavobacterium sp. MXW15]|uniref:ATP-grasp domain-containing protein n=1 Tax=Xanthomonas chitinilytica TaxID=2989819 RepID=A0ABT3JT65_9XANT|nr:ATP-grasp domain-containing protein [Xanthomonas sp. H13-6]MCW4454429.1 hypothetical protein [Flavobacterium sp. MXW15]MCW4471669.1 ATP-grasp domain-containing protein [Xanthomonas sp. H13-6]
MPSVLITGARAPIALDLARRFHAHGWRVHVADSVPAHAAGASRAVAGRHRIAPPRHAPEAFAADLSRLVHEHRIDLLLPTCEEVFYVAHLRHRLPAQLRVLADDFDRLRSLHSKWEFLALARAAGLPVPDSARVASLAEARDWTAGRAVVLKPEFSRFGVHVRLYPHGIPADAAPLPDGQPWVVQQLCAGTEYCSYAVAERGRLLAHAVYQPRHRLRRSASYYFAPAAPPGLREHAAALVAQLGCSGQVAFDWIVAGDGRAHVIECNPRGTSGLHLFAPGDALPRALAGDGDGVLEPGHRRAAMLAPLMYLDALPRALAAGRLAQWHADLRAGDDVLARPGDRAPLPATLRDLGHYGLQAARRRISLRAASTADIEWDGAPLA